MTTTKPSLVQLQPQSPPIDSKSPFANLSDDALTKLLKAPMFEVKRISEDHYQITVHGALPIAMPVQVTDAIKDWQRDRWLNRLINGLTNVASWVMRLGLTVVGLTAVYAAFTNPTVWSAAARMLGID
jgi:hypothetical protein